jgi:hypothetical protein
VTPITKKQRAPTTDLRSTFAIIGIYADVAELADALDLGSSTARCEGSSPFIRIKIQNKGFSFCVTLPITLPSTAVQSH